MTIQLDIAVTGDGRMDLAWHADRAALAWYLLIVRTGARKAYTALLLGGEFDRYVVSSLSRHQRYQVAVVGIFEGGASACSPWYSVTPRAGLAPKKEDDDGRGIAPSVRRVEKLMLMPQDARITAFWELTPGFADKVVLEVLEREVVVGRLELEPEVKSCAVSAERGTRLANGKAYRVRLSTRFASVAGHAPQEATCTPSAPGDERTANRGNDPKILVFPSLRPSPELAIFPEEQAAAQAEEQTQGKGADILCCHCAREVRWEGRRLVCTGCKAEFVQNADGDYLDVARLRFGLCRCCVPGRILVQHQGADVLVCTSSGKEHIRVAGQRSFRLIEDLPHGLCQCCRPRQPLVKEGKEVRCGKSRELHRCVDGRYVLVPSEMVFDAKAIDELMDAGLADLCQAGISRGRR
ncbi:MAG TPA: hypothetical protein VGK67_17290 [Myxococcales bacterium]